MPYPKNEANYLVVEPGDHDSEDVLTVANATMFRPFVVDVHGERRVAAVYPTPGDSSLGVVVYFVTVDEGVTRSIRQLPRDWDSVGISDRATFVRYLRPSEAIVIRGWEV